MKQIARTVALVSLLAFLVSQAGADVTRKSEIIRTFEAGSAGKGWLVVVDNVFGEIEVTGYDGDQVQVTAQKIIAARSEEKADTAEREVTLEIVEEGQTIELYVDGPFRNRHNRGLNWRGEKREEYKVLYDFQIKVPRNCEVELTTVNDGDVIVKALSGRFDISNVNGAIRMEELSGSGRVNAINGEVELEFKTNPRGDCVIDTINGEVRLYFEPELSADFYMKSMNGGVFTDFDLEPLPGKSIKTESNEKDHIYKIAHLSGVRAGKGGPEIELNTLNGDMFILSK